MRRAGGRARVAAAVATLAILALSSVAVAAGPGECDLDCPPPSNTPPTVSISASDTSPHRGQVVTFSATGSDADGDTLSYEWDLDGNGTYESDTGTTSSTTASYSALGARTVRVRVSDGTDTDTDSVDVTVENRAPSSAGFSTSPTSPTTLETVTFTGSGSDPDGDALSYRWEWDGDDDFNDALTQTASRSFATPGSYTVKLRVSDSHGGSITVGTAGNVTIANRPPVAALTAFPASPLTGETTTFDSTTSSDPDGTVTGRAWDLDDDGAFDDGNGATAARSFALPGSHTVRVRVTDNSGGTNIKSLTITVGNQPTVGDNGTPAPQSTILAPPTDLTLTFVKQKLAKALARGFVATARCAQACLVNSQLVLSGKLAQKLRLSKKAKATVVAKGSAPAPAGGTAQIKLKFTTKAKRAFNKLRSIKLSLVGTPSNASGVGAKKTRSVTLRR